MWIGTADLNGTDVLFSEGRTLLTILAGCVERGWRVGLLTLVVVVEGCMADSRLQTDEHKHS